MSTARDNIRQEARCILEQMTPKDRNVMELYIAGRVQESRQAQEASAEHIPSREPSGQALLFLCLLVPISVALGWGIWAQWTWRQPAVECTAAVDQARVECLVDRMGPVGDVVP